MPPLLSKVIIRLMRWLAKKTRNATSLLNIRELCRQFQDETGSLVSESGLETKIHRYRQKIHEIDEFDVETKVKMMFALSAPIDQGFLIELKKVADVEVDNKPRIIYYKQKDGGLELNAKNLIPSMKEGEQRSRSMIQFLAEKAKTVDFPMNDRAFLRDFKANDGCHDAIWCLDDRYTRVKKAIFESSEFDKNTKVKMMFISHARLSDEILEKLQKDAIVELDEMQRIKKYKANDGSLELEGDHSMSTRVKAALAKKKKRRGFNSDSEKEMDYEFDNQAGTSTERKRARISSPPSEIVEDENPEVEGPSTSTPLSISLLEFLNRLRRPAIKLNIPFVANKIDREIEILEKRDEQILINAIIESLETCIQILKTPDEMASDEVTISLSDYLYHLGLSMCYIAHPLMNDFQKKLRNLVAAEDQQIPLEHLRYAMDEVLEKINR